MHYLVGLGNIGERYVGTRHNVGWHVLNAYCATYSFPSPVASASLSGEVSEGARRGQPVTVGYPTTLMNHSGVMVKKLLREKGEGTLILVYDDIHIPMGEFKISAKGGSGGHNGVSSVIDSLGHQNFIRIRIGIAPVSFWTGKTVQLKGGKLPSYVLGPFSKREQQVIDSINDTLVEAIDFTIENGVERAMNKYN